MTFNKKKLIVPVVALLLLASFHAASAFSFGKFFRSVFGSHKVENTQPASSFSATKEDDTKQTTPPEEIKTIDPPVVIDPTPIEKKDPTPLPPVTIDPSIKPVVTPPAPKDPITEDDQIVAKYGMRDNADVHSIQAKLKVLGYLNGNADGNYGKVTVNAVQSFKTDYKINGDGYSVDKPTFQAIIKAKIKKLTSGAEQILLLSGKKGQNPPNATLYNDVYSSTDMYNWGLVSPNNPSATNKWLPKVGVYSESFYFQNKFWVIGPVGLFPEPNNGQIWNSPDGINWTKVNSTLPFESYSQYSAVVHNNKIYIISGYLQSDPQQSVPTVWSSSDGITWIVEATNLPFGIRLTPNLVSLNGNIYLIGGNVDNLTSYNDVWSSPDGVTWTKIAQNFTGTQTLEYSKSVVYNNKIFILGTKTPNGHYGAWSSPDGVSWTNVGVSFPVLHPNDWTWRTDVVVANGKMWYGDLQNLSDSGGNKLWSSNDGNVWIESCLNLPFANRDGYRMISNGGTPANTPDPCVQNTPTVTVTSPNGGELYHQGQQMTVTWTSTGFGPNSLVNIDLSTHDANGNYTNTFLMSASGLANDGTETFTIPMNVPNATNYAIHIYAFEAGSTTPAQDNSDGDFTITNQTSSCSSYQYISQWGTNGGGNGQFSFPSAITIDSTGNIYVIDSQNFRIQKFTSNGTYITEWGSFGSGNGQFSSTARGITTDSLGNVYVADTVNNRIQKFTSNGVFITKWGTLGTGNGQFHFPFGIATDSADNVYVAVQGQSRIQKFTSNGTYITQWGSMGTGNGQFLQPTGIAIDSSGNVYVADTSSNATYTNRIQKFTSNGTYITEWGTDGTGNGQFDVPLGITTDSSGNVYVADTNNNRIQKFTSNGTYITQWGTNGSGNGQFLHPEGIATDSAGYVYVVDKFNHRIQKFGCAIPPPPSTCSINSFSVPSSTALASGLSIPVSWSSNCKNVVLEANSGSYTLRYVGGGSGTHTFVAPSTGTVFSNTDSAVDITLIAGNNSDDTVSDTKSVPVSDVPSPSTNQCTINSLTAIPNPVSVGSPQTTLSWQAPAGCIVYVESWTPSASGLTTAHIFKPGTYYFNATDSVNTNLNSSTTYYVSAQAGPGSSAVLSAKTIDVKMGGVVPTSCVINTFTANPTTIPSGSASTLAWSTTGCPMAALESSASASSLHAVPVNSSISTGSLSQTTTFTLVAGTPHTGCTSFVGYSPIDGQPCITGAQTATVTVVVSNSSPTGKVFLMGGLNNSAGDLNDVWSSTNMTSWNQVLLNDPNTSSYWSPRPLFNSVQYFNNKLWILGGNDTSIGSTDIWSSPDGQVWTNVASAAWPARQSHASLVFNNKLWIFGGQTYSNGNFQQLNDVWSSSDGINWTQTTSNAPWTKRAHLAVVSFNNKMWVLGGTNNSGVSYSDVWSSSDGINWTQENSNAFSPRGYHTATVFNGRIWVIGGFATGNGYYDDVVSSSDGIVWTSTLAHGPWGPRMGHSVIVFDNKMWLLAGGQGINTLNNDAWSSVDGINWTQEVVSTTWPARFYQAVVTTP